MQSLNLSYLIDFIERLKLRYRRKNIPVFICIIHGLIKRRELRAPKKHFTVIIMSSIYHQSINYLNKLLSLTTAHSGCETDRWTFLASSCCICAGGGSDCGCFVLLSVVVLKLSNEKSLCSDGWYDAAGLLDGFQEYDLMNFFKQPHHYLPAKCCWDWCWSCWCCICSCTCCCWCRRSSIEWMSLRRLLSKWSNRDDISTSWTLMMLKAG